MIKRYPSKNVTLTSSFEKTNGLPPVHFLNSPCATDGEMNDTDGDTMMMEDGSSTTPDIDMSNQITTIDPSVVQSRISISASLAKENEVDEQPVFPKLSAMQAGGGRVEYRRVRCPPHRYTPLRENWEQILMPLVEYLKLQASACVCCLLFHVECLHLHSADTAILPTATRKEQTQMMKGCKVVSPSSCSWSLQTTNPPGSLDGVLGTHCATRVAVRCVWPCGGGEGLYSHTYTHMSMYVYA